MKKRKLFCAQWTPTDSQGRLLKLEFIEHLGFLAERGVDGVLVGGSTGEFLQLDNAIRKELLQIAVEHSKMEVIFNVSHPNPRTVEEFIHLGNSLPIHGMILLPPLYNPISPSELTTYFIHMAKHAKRPFYLYNFPERTHVRIELETIEAVYKQVPLAGIKLSGSDIAHLIAVTHWAHDKNFLCYGGNDVLLPELLSLGVHGCMGGLVNAIPEIFVKILEGKEIEACRAKLKRLSKLLGKLPFPYNVAALMEARDLTIGVFKMPVSQTTASAYQNLIAEMKIFLEQIEINHLAQSLEE